MKTRYPNVTVSPDRHKKLRARFRKAGYAPVYLKHLPGEPGFLAEYAKVKERAPVKVDEARPGSVHDLCRRYYGSADFRTKGGDERRARRRGIIEMFRAEFGDDMVQNFTFEHIEAILIAKTQKTTAASGRTIGGQVAAHNLRKELRRLFAYARKLKWIQTSPVDEAERIGKAKINGIHPWTEGEILQYQKRHPLGTKARLALEIMLWTGQRRGDARLFGPKHVADGKAGFTPGKTGRAMRMTLAPDLRRAIDAMPSVGLQSFLVTEFGKPFSKDGFGNKMREWCDQAGLPQCSSHGLRKAIARRTAEVGGTQQQLKAIGGWRGDSEVTTYTEGAEQERMANDAMAKIVTDFSSKEGQ